MFSERDRAALDETLFYATMPQDLAVRLIRQSTVRELGRGETLFIQDDPADHIFVVLDGWVKLARVTPDGAEAVVEVFTRGRSFGEGAALRGARYPVTASTATGARLLQTPASAILELLRERPDLAQAMLAATFRHLHHLVHQIEQLKARTGAERVAEFLVELSPVAQGACVVVMPYDKSLIAGRLGMKPETLSRAFARLRDLGVHVEGGVAEIDDVVALYRFANGER